MLLTKTPLGTLAYLGGLPATLEAFTWSWGQLVQYCNEYLCLPGQYVHLDRATVSYHSFARNSLAERFLGDWLWMTDTDHAFEPDIVARLLAWMERTGVGVMSGVYCHRTAPHSPVIYQWQESDTLLPIADWDRTVPVVQVGSAGAGCLLVKRHVFDRIREELKQSPFDPLPPLGEDHSFFKRCRQLEIPTYAAMLVESPHLQVRPLALRDYKAELVTDDTAPKIDAGGFR